MATEWFYTSGGQKAGPVSSQELKRLATQGILLPTDLLWKEGMKDWLPASKAKNLFADESSGISGDAAGQQPPPQNSLPNSEPANATEAPLTLGTRMQSAARATALKAEQAKLTNVSLPAAFLALGRHLYAGRLMAEEFPDSYRELDGLQAQVDAATMRAADATGTNLSEKAKALATKAAELAKVKAAEVQQLSLLKRLGQAACEGNRDNSIPAEMLTGIHALRKRLAEINAALLVSATPVQTSVGQAASVQGEGKAKRQWPRVIKWIGGSVALLFLMGFLFGNREEDSRHDGVTSLKTARNDAEGVGDRTPTSEADQSNSGEVDTTSSEYQVNKYLREQREQDAEAKRQRDEEDRRMGEEIARMVQAEQKENDRQQLEWDAARKKREADAAAERRKREAEELALAKQREEEARAEQNHQKPETGVNHRDVSPPPELAGRVRQGLFESHDAYISRIFNRTVTAILAQRYGTTCEPGEWKVVRPASSKKDNTHFESKVTLANGTKLKIWLHERDDEFVWTASVMKSDNAGLSLRDAVGYWKWDGTELTEDAYSVVACGHKMSEMREDAAFIADLEQQSKQLFMAFPKEAGVRAQIDAANRVSDSQKDLIAKRAVIEKKYSSEAAKSVFETVLGYERYIRAF